MRAVKHIAASAAAPAMAAVATIWSTFATTSGHWTIVLRPMAIALVVVVALAGVLWALTRSVSFATTASTFLVLIMLGHPLGGPLLVLIAVTITLRYWRHIRRQQSMQLPVAGIRVVAAIMLTVSAGSVAAGGAVSTRDLHFSGASVQAGTLQRDHPNIYVLLLDSYGRADYLQSIFGFDNQRFLGELEALGFDLYPDSRTLHDATPRTVLDMLSGSSADMPHAQRLPIGERDLIYREVRRRLAEAPALEELRAAGYHLTVIQPQVVHVVERGWDEEIDTGQITDFEVDLLSRSPLAPLTTQWVYDQQRERILDSVAAIRVRSGRHALLAHIMAPHPPFVLVPNSPRCWPRDCHLFSVSAEPLHVSDSEFARLVGAQTAATNELVLPAIRRLVAEDPEGVIIVMSDHGVRYSGDDPEEGHANLFAARTPGRANLFGEAPTPAHLFRTILAAY